MQDEVKKILDGKSEIELRRLVPLDQIRSSGAFFTNNELKDIAFGNEFAASITESSVILDPACGSGNLLLPSTEYFQRTNNLSETLNYWKSNLIGLDIYPEFVFTTKLRLILKAIMSGALPDKLTSNYYVNLLTCIKVGSFFDNLICLSNVSHILLNPPYTLVKAPDTCNWARGKVNSAALFLEACVKNSKTGTRIVAILPDVLRSGIRYKKWRKFIESNCEIRRIHLYGQFNSWADVDVFVLELIVYKEAVGNPFAWGIPEKVNEVMIGDKFNISIGSVVDYRDPYSGTSVKYIHSKELPAWSCLDDLAGTRVYSGRTFHPPFVVVRRTSRVGDKHRAVGTIINTQYDVAVENHLIVLQPKDGELSTCQHLLNVLKNDKTNKWLNETIRCRHLTIQSVASIPWWSS